MILCCILSGKFTSILLAFVLFLQIMDADDRIVFAMNVSTKRKKISRKYELLIVNVDFLIDL